MLPRDLFLSIAEEAVAAADLKDSGQKSELFAQLWKDDDEKFTAVKNQYQKMLSSTSDEKAVAWREKTGVEVPNTSNDAMEVDTTANNL